MATTVKKVKTLEFKAPRRRKSLIEWGDSSKQAHVLDWRQRAQDFGLAVETNEDLEEGGPFVPSPEQILREEEPEAFEDQPIGVEQDEREEEQLEEGQPGAAREEVDLV